MAIKSKDINIGQAFYKGNPISRIINKGNVVFESSENIIRGTVDTTKQPPSGGEGAGDYSPVFYCLRIGVPSLMGYNPEHFLKPIQGERVYSYTIDWGDGSPTETIRFANESTGDGYNPPSEPYPEAIHTYENVPDGQYTFTITRHEDNTNIDWAYFISFTGSYGLVSIDSVPNNSDCWGEDGAEYIMSALFLLCNNLVSVPENFTMSKHHTVINFGVGYATFAGCHSLIRLPDNFSLPQDVVEYYPNFLPRSFCREMFTECKSLEYLPSLFAFPLAYTTTDTEIHVDIGSISDMGIAYTMFYGCSKLKTIPATLLPVADLCFSGIHHRGSQSGMFSGTQIPRGTNGFPDCAGGI